MHFCRAVTFRSTTDGKTKTDIIEFPRGTKGIFLMDYLHGRYCILRTDAKTEPSTPPPTAATLPATVTSGAADSTNAQLNSTTAASNENGTPVTTEATSSATPGDGASGETGATTTTTVAASTTNTTNSTASGSERAADEGSACFPSAALVELRNGQTVPMADLRIGHVVKTGRDAYSPIFAFTHRIKDGSRKFIKIHTSSGHIISATSGHFIYANEFLTAAGSVRPGDTVTLGCGGFSYVTRVETVKRAGLYNPQTVHGDIVVDGVLASTYTTAVEPGVAHAVLTPLRAIYQLFGLSTRLLETGSETFRQALPKCLPVVA